MSNKPSVFISYRRSDSSAIAGRIYDRLAPALGKANVFKDSYNIPHGADFRGVIKSNVARCNVVLVVIGPAWLDVTEKDNPSLRRLDNPNDWVRFEVETGLQIPGTMIIPVLVQNASMPPESKLPATLRELAFKNAISVRDDPDFDNDMARLIQSLRGSTLPTRVLTIAAIIVMLAIVGVFLLSNRGNDGSLTALDTTPTLSPKLTDTLPPTSTSSPTLTVTLSPTPTPVPTDTPTATFTVPQESTATPVIDFGATATEALLQRTADAQQAMNAALLAENTHIAETATAYALPTATNAPEASPSPTQPPTVTPFVPTAIATAGYPCDATVVSRTVGATYLNVVRDLPRPNANLQAPIQANSPIKVQRKIDETTEQSWYQISDQKNTRLGWIPVEFVVLSEDCPSE
ncbi:MAG: toll/interleukin-1 receptor domain-containing protein [Chloroflexota bacterium]